MSKDKTSMENGLPAVATIQRSQSFSEKSNSLSGDLQDDTNIDYGSHRFRFDSGSTVVSSSEDDSVSLAQLLHNIRRENATLRALNASLVEEIDDLLVDGQQTDGKGGKRSNGEASASRRNERLVAVRDNGSVNQSSATFSGHEERSIVIEQGALISTLTTELADLKRAHGGLTRLKEEYEHYVKEAKELHAKQSAAAGLDEKVTENPVYAESKEEPLQLRLGSGNQDLQRENIELRELNQSLKLELAQLQQELRLNQGLQGELRAEYEALQRAQRNFKEENKDLQEQLESVISNSVSIHEAKIISENKELSEENERLGEIETKLKLQHEADQKTIESLSIRVKEAERQLEVVVQNWRSDVLAEDTNGLGARTRSESSYFGETKRDAVSLQASLERQRTMEAFRQVGLNKQAELKRQRSLPQQGEVKIPTTSASEPVPAQAQAQAPVTALREEGGQFGLAQESPQLDNEERVKGLEAQFRQLQEGFDAQLVKERETVLKHQAELSRAESINQDLRTRLAENKKKVTDFQVQLVEEMKQSAQYLQEKNKLNKDNFRLQIALEDQENLRKEDNLRLQSALEDQENLRERVAELESIQAELLAEDTVSKLYESLKREKGDNKTYFAEQVFFTTTISRDGDSVIGIGIAYDVDQGHLVLFREGDEEKWQECEDVSQMTHVLLEALHESQQRQFQAEMGVLSEERAYSTEMEGVVPPEPRPPVVGVTSSGANDAAKIRVERSAIMHTISSVADDELEAGNAVLGSRTNSYQSTNSFSGSLRDEHDNILAKMGGRINDLEEENAKLQAVLRAKEYSLGLLLNNIAQARDKAEGELGSRTSSYQSVDSFSSSLRDEREFSSQIETAHSERDQALEGEQRAQVEINELQATNKILLQKAQELEKQLRSSVAADKQEFSQQLGKSEEVRDEAEGGLGSRTGSYQSVGNFGRSLRDDYLAIIDEKNIQIEDLEEENARLQATSGRIEDELKLLSKTIREDKEAIEPATREMAIQAYHSLKFEHESGISKYFVETDDDSDEGLGLSFTAELNGNKIKVSVDDESLSVQLISQEGEERLLDGGEALLALTNILRESKEHIDEAQNDEAEYEDDRNEGAPVDLGARPMQLATENNKLNAFNAELPTRMRELEENEMEVGRLRAQNTQLILERVRDLSSSQGSSRNHSSSERVDGGLSDAVLLPRGREQQKSVSVPSDGAGTSSALPSEGAQGHRVLQTLVGQHQNKERFNGENATLKSSLETLRADKAGLEERLQSSAADNSKLRQELDKMSALNTEANTEILQLAIEKDAAERKLSDLLTELTSLKLGNIRDKSRISDSSNSSSVISSTSTERLLSRRAKTQALESSKHKASQVPLSTQFQRRTDFEDDSSESDYEYEEEGVGNGLGLRTTLYQSSNEGLSEDGQDVSIVNLEEENAELRADLKFAIRAVAIQVYELLNLDRHESSFDDTEVVDDGYQTVSFTTKLNGDKIKVSLDKKAVRAEYVVSEVGKERILHDRDVLSALIGALSESKLHKGEVIQVGFAGLQATSAAAPASDSLVGGELDGAGVSSSRSEVVTPSSGPLLRRRSGVLSQGAESADESEYSDDFEEEELDDRSRALALKPANVSTVDSGGMEEVNVSSGSGLGVNGSASAGGENKVVAEHVAKPLDMSSDHDDADLKGENEALRAQLAKLQKNLDAKNEAMKAMEASSKKSISELTKTWEETHEEITRLRALELERNKAADVPNPRGVVAQSADLQNRLREAERVAQEAQEARQAAASEATKLRESNAALVAQLAVSQEVLASAEEEHTAEVGNKNDEIVTIRAVVTSKEAELKEAKQQIEALLNENRTSGAENKRLTEYAAAQAALATKQTERISQLEQEAQTVREAAEQARLAAKRELDAARIDGSSKDATIALQNTEIDTLKSEGATVRGSLDELRAKFVAQETELSTVSAERDTLAQRVQEVEARLTAQEEQARSNDEWYQQEIDRTQAELLKTETERDAFDTDKLGLKEELTTVRNENVTLASREAEGLERLRQLQDQFNALEQTVATLTSEKDTAVDALRSERGQFQIDLVRIQSELDTVRAAVGVAEAAKRDAESEAARQQDLVAAKQSENDALQAVIDEKVVQKRFDDAANEDLQQRLRDQQGELDALKGELERSKAETAETAEQAGREIRVLRAQAEKAAQDAAAAAAAAAQQLEAERARAAEQARARAAEQARAEAAEQARAEGLRQVNQQLQEELARARAEELARLEAEKWSNVRKRLGVTYHALKAAHEMGIVNEGGGALVGNSTGTPGRFYNIFKAEGERYGIRKEGGGFNICVLHQDDNKFYPINDLVAQEAALAALEKYIEETILPAQQAALKAKDAEIAQLQATNQDLNSQLTDSQAEVGRLNAENKWLKHKHGEEHELSPVLERAARAMCCSTIQTPDDIRDMDLVRRYEGAIARAILNLQGYLEHTSAETADAILSRKIISLDINGNNKFKPADPLSICVRSRAASEGTGGPMVDFSKLERVEEELNDEAFKAKVTELKAIIGRNKVKIEKGGSLSINDREAITKLVVTDIQKAIISYNNSVVSEADVIALTAFGAALKDHEAGSGNSNELQQCINGNLLKMQSVSKSNEEFKDMLDLVLPVIKRNNALDPLRPNGEVTTFAQLEDNKSKRPSSIARVAYGELLIAREEQQKKGSQATH